MQHPGRLTSQGAVMCANPRYLLERYFSFVELRGSTKVAFAVEPVLNIGPFLAGVKLIHFRGHLTVQRRGV